MTNCDFTKNDTPNSFSARKKAPQKMAHPVPACLIVTPGGQGSRKSSQITSKTRQRTQDGTLQRETRKTAQYLYISLRLSFKEFQLFLLEFLFIITYSYLILTLVPRVILTRKSNKVCPELINSLRQKIRPKKLCVLAKSVSWL